MQLLLSDSSLTIVSLSVSLCFFFIVRKNGIQISFDFNAEQAAAASDQEMVVFEEVVAPAMVECQELLKQSGDSVSSEGLELLAKWKLGMKK